MVQSWFASNVARTNQLDMFYRTQVVYPKDGLHMQAPWVKIWISSCYEVFIVSIDGGSDITSGVSISTKCLTAHLHRTRL